MAFQNEFSHDNIFEDRGSESLRGAISVKQGTGNRLQIGVQSNFSGSVKITGDNNKVLIGENCHFRGDILVRGSNQTVSFGDFSTTMSVYILCQESCDVLIGNHCMFSRNVEVRTTDAHSVIDRVTLKRINKPASINIGHHVWVGVGALISKGASVPSDSIVAAMTFVNKSFDEEGVVIAGTPAKIVRRDITWNRGRHPDFSNIDIDYWK